MTYRGHVKNGTVVLDEPVELPDGAEVAVVVIGSSEGTSSEDSGPTLYERLESVVGVAKGLPPDASRNIEHYLYGAPRA